MILICRRLLLFSCRRSVHVFVHSCRPISLPFWKFPVYCELITTHLLPPSVLSVRLNHFCWRCNLWAFFLRAKTDQKLPSKYYRSQEHLSDLAAISIKNERASSWIRPVLFQRFCRREGMKTEVWRWLWHIMYIENWKWKTTLLNSYSVCSMWFSCYVIADDANLLNL